MLLAWDGGRVAAVRDCFSAIDTETRGVVVLMSHSLVLPEWRRTGVAALLRASPVVFARRHAAERGIEPSEIVLVAEMEPIEPHAEATLVRLAAYLGAGFAIVPPWIVPYAQPDFRDIDALGVPAKPIPFMLLVRQVGQEAAPTITWSRIRAILNSLIAVHGPSIHPSQLTDIRWQVIQNNDATPGAAVELYRPRPRSAEDLAPLLRSALAPHYPPEWVGDPGDVAADEAALAAALG